MSRIPINPVETVSWTVLAFLLLGGVAKADVTVCNDFRAPIHVVFAYPDHDDFTATGWWNVGSNSCQTADFVFQGNDLYYAADSDDYKDGRFTKHDHWGNKVKLFVNKDNFKSDNAKHSRRGAKAEMFSLVQVSQPDPAKPPKITFHFMPGKTSIDIKASP
jgi:uncharacterized membrane protein